ncbi:histidine kinase N-terminal 7TM domain-containing protein [Desulfitibacter alkalitolerans]|uniref:sensor histidine kinase n=1 Tax=Desulfitibacter alkalitolerans TaxID=264641 RepID=UPI000487D910|nr:histidine kinase N-terminal 7TM domain-containing protein [Desulfitibacter alkalitolerans]
MTETFVYQSYYIALFHVLALFLLVFINAVIYLKAVKSPLLSSFFVLQGILALWIVSKILKTFAPNAILKFFFVVSQYAGVCFLGVALIVFAHIYANGVKPSKKLMLPLSIISALFFLIIVTNPLHYLFYTHFDFWGDSFGPLFYLFQGFSFSLFAIGVILCAKRFFGRFSPKPIQTLLLTTAIAIPMIANILYVFRYFKKIFGFSPPFDITPMSASASLIIFAFATFKLQFFDNLKIARRAALSNVPEGILLTTGDRIAGFNETFIKMPAAGQLIPQGKKSLVSASGNGTFKENQKLSFAFDTNKGQDFIYQTGNDNYIRVIYRPITQKSFCGAFIRFIDVTVKQTILKKLQMRNAELQSANQQLELQAEIKKRLVVTRTCNFIAQEAHDILGHSIMLAISLLEIARLSKTDTQASEYMHKAKKILSDSLKEINSITSVENKSPLLRQNIEGRLEKLADEFRSAFIDVEINCSSLQHELEKAIEDTIFKVCREAITNALRHGKANRVDIILRSKNEKIELFIIDNGLGCQTVQKGMGLKGMEQRVSRLKGTFNCHPLYGQGFCVQSAIPLYPMTTVG